MREALPLRPRLFVNGQLIRAFHAAPAPCGILGLLEERGTSAPFLALRLRESLVRRRDARALRFGHALLGEPQAEVLQFGVTFFEISAYHLLVNPNNPVVQAVLANIIERRRYFVFAIAPDQLTTTFRADLDPDGLTRLSEHRRRLRLSTTGDAEYRSVMAHFRRNPVPPGRVLEWVCRDNTDYLDFTRHRFEMNAAH